MFIKTFINSRKPEAPMVSECVITRINGHPRASVCFSGCGNAIFWCIKRAGTTFRQHHCWNCFKLRKMSTSEQMLLVLVNTCSYLLLRRGRWSCPATVYSKTFSCTTSSFLWLDWCILQEISYYLLVFEVNFVLAASHSGLCLEDSSNSYNPG